MAYKKAAIEIKDVVKKSSIHLVGIELEGAWKDVPKGVTWVGARPPGAGELGRDGSLDPMAQRHPEYEIIGELPSPPIKESEIDDWMKFHYPVLVEKECGMHVHISLVNPLRYMRLMDDEAYAATVIEYLKRWATEEKIPTDNPVWDRLAGNSVYCQHVFMPDEQVKNTRKDFDKTRPGHRYTALNFCFGRESGTIECRVLPMVTDVEQAIRGVKKFIAITNGYLAATAKREKIYKSVTELDTRKSVSSYRVSV